jgi:hypothetical protein
VRHSRLGDEAKNGKESDFMIARTWRGWVHTDRAAAVELLAADQGISPAAAAARLAPVPLDLALDPAGLQSVLDLRARFGLTPPLGPEVARYYTLEFLPAASE